VALIVSKTRAEKAGKRLSCVVSVVRFIAIGEAKRWRTPGHGLLNWRLLLVIALVPLRGAPVAVAVAIAVDVAIGLALTGKLWLLRLLRLLVGAHLGTLRHQYPIIVLGVLEVVLLHHAITGGAGITGELQVLLVHMGGGAANLDIRSGGIKRPVVIVVMVVVAVVVLRPTAASA
jgi:hypothetical protein